VGSPRDGATFATTGKDGTFRVWESATRKILRQSDGHAQALVGGRVVLSDDGKFLAGSVNMMTPFTSGTWPRAKDLHSLHGHRNGPLTVAFAPDGKTADRQPRRHEEQARGGLVAAPLGLSHRLKSWRLWRQPQEGRGHPHPVRAARRFPDDDHYSGLVRQIDPLGSKELSAWNLPTREIKEDGKTYLRYAGIDWPSRPMAHLAGNQCGPD